MLAFTNETDEPFQGKGSMELRYGSAEVSLSDRVRLIAEMSRKRYRKF